MSEPVIRPEVVRALILARGDEREAVAERTGATVEELSAALRAWLDSALMEQDMLAGPDPLRYTYHDLRRIIGMGQAAELLGELLPRWIIEPDRPASDWLKTADAETVARIERLLRDLA